MEDDKEKKQEKTIPSVSMEELRNMINSNIQCMRHQ